MLKPGLRRNILRLYACPALQGECRKGLRKQLTGLSVREVQQLRGICLTQQPAAKTSGVVHTQDEATREFLLDTGVHGDVVRILQVRIDDGGAIARA